VYSYIIFITQYWGDKIYCVPLCPKVGGGHVLPSPLKLGPCFVYILPTRESVFLTSSS